MRRRALGDALAEAGLEALAAGLDAAVGLAAADDRWPDENPHGGARRAALAVFGRAPPGIRSVVHVFLALHERVLLGDATTHVRHLLGVERVRRIRRAVRGAVFAEPLGQPQGLGRRRERRDARAFLQVQVVDAARRLAHLAELVDLGARGRRAHRALRARVAHQLGVHRRLHAVNALVHVGLLPEHVLATHVRALVERVERGDAHRAGRGGVPEPTRRVDEAWKSVRGRSRLCRRGFLRGNGNNDFQSALVDSATDHEPLRPSRSRSRRSSSRRKISREVSELSVAGFLSVESGKLDRL